MRGPTIDGFVGSALHGLGSTPHSRGPCARHGDCASDGEEDGVAPGAIGEHRFSPGITLNAVPVQVAKVLGLPSLSEDARG